MRRSSHLRPARTMAVGLLAMLIGMGGTGIASTALARTGGHKSAKSKKKKKTPVLVKCAATTVTCKGRSGPTGPTGPAGPNGAAGAAAAPGTALGYAKITAAGTVVAGTAKNITSANVTKVGTAGYCFAGMPFTPGTASANVAFSGTPPDAFAQVELRSGDPVFLTAECSAVAQAFVFTVVGAAGKAEPFYVSFS